MKDKTGDLWVVQSNSLIEHRVREGLCRLKLSDRRLFALLIAKVDPFSESDDFEPMRISVSEYQRINGLVVGGGRAFDQLKQSVKSLMGIVIEWPDITSPGKWKLSQILSEGEYYEGEGWMEIKLHKSLKSVLLGLRSAFSKYRLEMAGLFSSVYAWRLFELINSKLHQKQSICAFEVSELRSMFDIEEDKFKVFANFRRKVLDIAVRQCNEHADFEVEYSLDRSGSRGGKVSRIVFSWKIRSPEKMKKVRELSAEEKLMDEFSTWPKPEKLEFWKWYVDHEPTETKLDPLKPEWGKVTPSRIQTALSYYIKDRNQGKLALV